MTNSFVFIRKVNQTPQPMIRFINDTKTDFPFMCSCIYTQNKINSGKLTLTSEVRYKLSLMLHYANMQNTQNRPLPSILYVHIIYSMIYFFPLTRRRENK